MSSSIAQNIEALCQEQGIERDLVIDAMKEAVRAAAKKQFKSGEDIQVDWNSETGIELSASKVVVDAVENPQPNSQLKRLVNSPVTKLNLGMLCFCLCRWKSLVELPRRLQNRFSFKRFGMLFEATFTSNTSTR
jgi:N utilization substance protein A